MMINGGSPGPHFLQGITLFTFNVPYLEALTNF